MSTFYERLKLLRADKKITQRQLANDIKCSNSTIALYETGQRNFDPDTLQQIADYFNVTVDYLLGRSEVKNTELPEGAIKVGNFYKLPILGIIRAG